MCEYRDPENNFSLDYPEGWLPLTHEGSPHVSLASLTTGGYLKVECYEFDHPQPDTLRPDRTMRALLDNERRCWPEIGEPEIEIGHSNGSAMAYTAYTRREAVGDDNSDFGHSRAWVFARGNVQVRCLYRCRTADEGVDDEELDSIINSLEISDCAHISPSDFTSYYHSLLKLKRPTTPIAAPQGLTLTLSDGQTISLEHLYHHYLLEPARLDELIESHIQRLDYCGDDVPDLKNYRAIKKLLFPKLFRANTTRGLPAHRVEFWPGLAIGAVVQGRVFTYGVNTERLKNWGKKNLHDIMDDLMDNLYGIPPITPRGLRNDQNEHLAISYVDHPFSASFILFEDFYETTSHNLGATEFLVGLPDPSCVSCFRDDDPRFVVQHTALLRWDYHRSLERLTDAIYLVSGPDPRAVKPYDILHCCPKKV